MPFMTNRVLQGHVLDRLKELPDESVDCIFTSPPYYFLRDYGTSTVTVWDGDPRCGHEWGKETYVRKRGAAKEATAKTGDQLREVYRVWYHQGSFCNRCGAWRGQLGLEPYPELYIQHLIQVFDECKRVLKRTGTLWVNIGDTYSGSGKGTGGNYELSYKQRSNRGAYFLKDSGIKPKIITDAPAKSLLFVPELLVSRMIYEKGWILRNIIIWRKHNAMPESVGDRFSRKWEPVYFFSKSRSYWFDQDAERRPLKYPETLGPRPDRGKTAGCHLSGKRAGNPAGANYGDVWEINTEPYPEAHFAVFPLRLASLVIKFACPENVCAKCGEPRQRMMNGWSDCGCGAGWKRGVVLDPFMGSGTVAEAAVSLNRDWLGIELNPDYVKLVEKRLKKYPTKRLEEFVSCPSWPSGGNG